MSRPKKKVAEQLKALLKMEADLKMKIALTEKLVASENSADQMKRTVILGKACLAIFADPLNAKNAAAIERLAIEMMSSRDLKWYREHPHGLINSEASTRTNQTSPAAASQAESSTDRASSSESQSSGQQGEYLG